MMGTVADGRTDREDGGFPVVKNIVNTDNIGKKLACGAGIPGVCLFLALWANPN